MEEKEEIGMYKRFRQSFLGEIVQIVVISILVVVPFRAYVAQPFLVSGPSMDDTFANGQYLIVDELTYQFRNPARGEVLIFHYPLDTKKYFIKRVIGLPGETIEIKNNIITICQSACATDTNKLILDEPYVKASTADPLATLRPDISVTLKADEYYVLGDNRGLSSDSRYWGPVKRDLISGRPIFRLFPLAQISVFPGQVNNY